MTARPVPALSDLSVTELLTLSRMGFLPHGMVIGACVYEADTRNMPGNAGDLLAAILGNAGALAQLTSMPTGEVTALSEAVRAARGQAIERMRWQAQQMNAEGIVGVRLEVEHHLWRGGHQVAKFVAIGTAVGFDADHAPDELRSAPSLKLSNGAPFTSDLSGHDFVALLRSGHRPVTVASGSCIYRLDTSELQQYRGTNAEIGTFTRAFFDARETAMGRLQFDLFSAWPPGHPDAPIGIVGMTVTENVHRPQALGGKNALNAMSRVPIVEFTAVGTAIAPLAPNDPRRAPIPKPLAVVPLDR